jgi:hypothetical protein
MSAVQNETAEILKPLIQGRAVRVRPKELFQIATWATMTAMCAEFKDPKTVAVSKASRHDFKRNPRPRPNWMIWIARVSGDDAQISYEHSGIVTTHRREEDRAWLLRQRPNAQATILVIGHFCVVAMSKCSEPLVSREREFAQKFGSTYDLVPIWPFGPYAVEWAETKEISILDTVDLSEAIMRSFTGIPGFP